MSEEDPFVRHEPCPKCGSRDNLARYQSGSASCFTAGCNYYESPEGESQFTGRRMEINRIPGESRADAARKIALETNSKYRVTTYVHNNVEYKVYPYFDRDATLVALKYRGVKDKTFRFEGSSSQSGLFGEHLFPPNKNVTLTITEGEEDALAAYQMMGSRYPVVSVRTGAKGAVKDIKQSFQYCDSFQKINICFDNDEAGRTAAKEVAQLFSPGQVIITRLDLKDAGEYLKEGKVKDFTQKWWNAEEYTPDGIVNAKNLRDAIFNPPKVTSVPYPWNCLNDFTYGFRQKELVTITAGSGMGKSSVMRELEHWLLMNTKDNIGILALEESTDRTGLGIMSVEANQLLHLPDTVISNDEKERVFDNTLGTGRIFLHDHFGSTDEDNLISKIRYMAKALDCKWIVLDHISIAVSGMEGDNERQLIDRLMTKLRTLVQETGVGMFVVSHLRRPSGDKGHERGAEVSLNQLRGSHSIAQLSDIVLGLERDQQAENEDARNLTLIRVIKNRFTGYTGPACWLKYNKYTGRLSESGRPDEGSDF